MRTTQSARFTPIAAVSTRTSRGPGGRISSSANSRRSKPAGSAHDDSLHACTASASSAPKPSPILRTRRPGRVLRRGSGRAAGCLVWAPACGARVPAGPTLAATKRSPDGQVGYVVALEQRLDDLATAHRPARGDDDADGQPVQSSEQTPARRTCSAALTRRPNGAPQYRRARRSCA